MSDNAIVPVDRLTEFEKRIVDFLPGGDKLPHEVRIAMAQISIAHGLDPWLREVWPIPVRGGGYDLFIGISGWRNAAHRSGEYWGRRFEKVSDEERQWLGAGPKDLVVRCIVMRRKTGQPPAEYDGYGIARPDEQSRMNKFQLARLRAERDAMKAAFPISSPFGMRVAVSDDEGEVINGDHEWHLTGSKIESHDVEPTVTVTPAQPDTLDQLTQATGHDAVTNAPAPEATEVAAVDWQMKFNTLCIDKNLSKPIRDALLQDAGGDLQTAYEKGVKRFGNGKK